MTSIQPVSPLAAIRKLLGVMRKNADNSEQRRAKQAAKPLPVEQGNEQQTSHIDETV